MPAGGPNGPLSGKSSTRSRETARVPDTTLSPVYDIADRYVDAFAALDPISATGAGIAGHDHELTDYSPAGSRDAGRARPRHARGARRARRSTTDDDRIAAERDARAAPARPSTSTTPASGCATLRVLGSPVQVDPHRAST